VSTTEIIVGSAAVVVAILYYWGGWYVRYRRFKRTGRYYKNTLEKARIIRDDEGRI
jgi:membrane protein DedA with SNARE-associated domain